MKKAILTASILLAFAVSAQTVDFTDNPPVRDTLGQSGSWNAGGASGLVLDCYCKMAPQTSNSFYTVLQRCRLSFSANGTLTHAELLPERVRIQSSCQTNVFSRIPRTNSVNRLSLRNADRAKSPGTSTASKIQ